MQYENIREAVFLSRPNRFIAHVEIDGREVVAHVKNTGRCKELLIAGVTVLVQEFDSPKRKTNYDIIAVYKGDRLINMDSQVPNKVFAEWAVNSGYFKNITLLKAETTYGASRFDFYMEADGRKIFIEVKGVTLEENGIVRFPDAPTERGLKHVYELCGCVDEGFEAYVVFIVQMDGVRYLTPNVTTHKAFGDALIEAEGRGVKLLALDCTVTPDSITAKNFVPICL
ncbi:MAG: DNA/RNA nuclease SfsA [Angelakisella sp.]